MRIAFSGHVIRLFTVSCIATQFARESFGICSFRGLCMREYDLGPAYTEVGDHR